VYSNRVNQLAATPSAVSRNNQILSRTSGPAYITHRPHTHSW